MFGPDPSTQSLAYTRPDKLAVAPVGLQTGSTVEKHAIATHRNPSPLQSPAISYLALSAYRGRPRRLADGSSGLGRYDVFVVPIPEPFFCGRVLALDALEERGNHRQRILLGKIAAGLFVPERAIMLDVFASGLDGTYAERGGRALEKVPEGRQFG